MLSQFVVGRSQEIVNGCWMGLDTPVNQVLAGVFRSLHSTRIYTYPLVYSYNDYLKQEELLSYH